MALQTLVIAMRVLRKNPLFTLTAVVTIALGLGATTAIFSVTNGVLLESLPYKDPDRVVVAGTDLRQRHVRNLPFSNADFIDLRDGTKSVFEDMAGVFTFRDVAPMEDGTPEQTRFAIVTTNFFRLLGGRIALGRDLNDEDGLPQPPRPQPGQTTPQAGQPVPARLPLSAVISYEYFQRRFGGNAAILGHPMPGSGAQPSPIIVGVLAPHFRLYFPPEADQESAPDIWIANRLGYDAAQRESFSILPVGRLKPGVTVEQAQAAADNVAAEARKNFLIARTAGYYIQIEPMRKHLVSGCVPRFGVDGMAVFLVIACANVANLLLVRASLRERELAVRAALGANRWRLIVSLLTEAGLITAMGTVIALGLAWIKFASCMVSRRRICRAWRLSGSIHSCWESPRSTCLAATAIFGMLPAWRASKPGVAKLLGKQPKRRTSGRKALCAMR